MLRRARRVALALALGGALGAGPAAASEKLVAGDAEAREGFVTAGSEGATYHLRGGTVVRLAPGTSVRFTTTTQLKLGAPGGASTWARVMALRSGRVDVTVPATGDAHALLVNGPRKVSIVGTASRYALYTRDGSVNFAVFEGRGLAAVGDTWRPLEAGFARSLDDGGVEQKRAIVGTPAARVERPLSVVIDESRARVEATWTAVSGAKEYEAVLETTSDPTAVRTQRTTGTRAEFRDLPAGEYSVRVRAFDDEGLEWVSSPPVGARVVGVRLPEGAFVDASGVVHLGRSQGVELVDTANLEATYGRSNHFVPAPKRISGGRAASLRVRFRAHGSSAEAALDLQARQLAAEIEMTPRHAEWPRDDVAVRVRLVDRSGAPIPATVKAIPKVTINVDPTEVAWRRAGASWTGTVPAPRGKGPWVIRVEVSDQHGERLGHDFLEVTEARKPGDGTRSSAGRARGGASL